MSVKRLLSLAARALQLSGIGCATDAVLLSGLRNNDAAIPALFHCLHDLIVLYLVYGGTIPRREEALAQLWRRYKSMGDDAHTAAEFLYFCERHLVGIGFLLPLTDPTVSSIKAFASTSSLSPKTLALAILYVLLFCDCIREVSLQELGDASSLEADLRSLTARLSSAPPGAGPAAPAAPGAPATRAAREPGRGSTLAGGLVLQLHTAWSSVRFLADRLLELLGVWNCGASSTLHPAELARVLADGRAGLGAGCAEPSEAALGLARLLQALQRVDQVTDLLCRLLHRGVQEVVADRAQAGCTILRSAEFYEPSAEEARLAARFREGLRSAYILPRPSPAEAPSPRDPALFPFVRSSVPRALSADSVKRVAQAHADATACADAAKSRLEALLQTQLHRHGLALGSLKGAARGCRQAKQGAGGAGGAEGAESSR